MPAELADAPAEGQPFYVSSSLTPSGAPVLVARTIRGGAFIHIGHADGKECVIDRSGSRIWMTWPPDARVDPYGFLLEFVLGFVLRLRGVLCLHAAGVVIGGRAVALAGPAGIGKSTFAAMLGARGHEVVTDDVSAFTSRDGMFVIQPGPARLRPRPDAIGLISRTVGTLSWNLASDGRYAEISLSQPSLTQRLEATSLGAICFLERGPAVAGARLVPLHPADALERLLGDTWGEPPADRSMRAHEFREVSELVAVTSSHLLQFDPAEMDPAVVCRLIERNADRWFPRKAKAETWACTGTAPATRGRAL